MEAVKAVLRPFKAGLTTEEQDELGRAAAAAAAGREVPSALLQTAPGRTMQCHGAEFRQMSSLARSGRPTSVCCLPVLNPLGSFYQAWLILTNITDLTYTAFIVALSIAFNDPDSFDTGGWLDYADLIGSIIYIVDLVLGFHTGVVAKWDTRAVVVRDGRKAATFYINHSTFLPDLLACAPAVVQALLLITGTRAERLRLMYLIRLLRLLRVVRLLKSITPGGGAGTTMPFMAALTTRTLLLFNALFSLAVLVNVMGCVWWNVAVNEGLENSWAAAVSAAKNIDLINGSNVDRWVTSIYFALTTVATIGYGDVTPVTIPEMGVTVVFEMIGVAFFGYIINTATTILAASGPKARRAQAIKAKLEDAEEVMRDMEMPNFLKRKIRAYYSDQWAPPEEGPRDARFQLYLELPPRLRTRVVQEKQEGPLAQLGFLPDGLTPRQRKQVMYILADASVPMSLEAGQLLEEAVPEVPGGSLGFDLSGPCIHILDEGEMRALRPGAQFDPESSIGGRVDFCGPAVIGLTVLFSPDVAPNGGGGDAGQQGGGAGGTTSSSSSDARDDDEDDGEGSTHAGGTLSRYWKRSAVALTECHLWRVNCSQLAAQLRAKQPFVLLHLLDKLLLSLGIDAAAESRSGSLAAAGTEASAPPPPPAPPAPPVQQQPPQLQQQATFRSGAAARLLRLRADLLDEIAAAKETSSVGSDGGAVDKGEEASGRFGLRHSLLHSHWWGRGSVELAEVSVGLPGGRSRASGFGPDVWQAESYTTAQVAAEEEEEGAP